MTQLETIPSRLQVTPTYDANGQRLIKSQDSSPPNDTNLVEASSTGQMRKADEQHDEEPPAQRLRTSSQPPKRGQPIKSADGVKAWDKEPQSPHSNEKFDRPGKEEFLCDKFFNTRSEATTHYNKVHRQPGSYVCEWNPRKCDASFDKRAQLVEHRKQVHKGRFPCPEAEQFDCEKDFCSAGTARTHINTHYDNACACDHPGCGQVLSDKYKLEDHMVKKHDGTWVKYSCPVAGEYKCDEVFTTYSYAKHHADQKHMGFWYCTVPMCERAVCEWPMGLRDWQRHEKKHEEQGDFAALGERPEPRHVPGGAPGSADIKDMEEEEGLEVQSSADMDKSEKEKSSVTEIRDVEVIDFEPFDASLEEHRTKIKARNQECVGPRHCDDRGFVVIPCPYNTKISTETTLYKAWTGSTNSSNGIWLRSRCASCSAQLRLDEIMKSNFWAQPGQKHCCFKSCEKPMKKGLKFCKEHMSKSKNRVKEAYGPSCSDVEIFRKLRALLQSSLAKVWKYDDEGVLVSRMFAAIDKIRSGETSGSDVICLDLEFSASTHRVFEVGACEYESGKTLIEARVKPDVAYDELHRPDPHSSKATQENVWISKRTYAKVYLRKSVPHLNVHEIAAKLREAGVGQRTIILAWHKYHADYDLLQAFLKENGHGDILPPRSQCIPFIPRFQKNLGDAKLSGGKMFPLALEILFPLLFPGHELVGKNHAALANAQQLRLVAQVFEDACRRPANREVVIPKYTSKQSIPALLEGSDEQKKSQDGPMGQPSGGKQPDITHQQRASTTSMDAGVPATESSSVAQPVGRQQPTTTKKKRQGSEKTAGGWG
ncbi:hypothetical protein CBS470a_002090 [Colletotrichum nupharicola]|nr:hypothetical protein CBS470a_002090 [Colletotrichum nupharicola]